MRPARPSRWSGRRAELAADVCRETGSGAASTANDRGADDHRAPTTAPTTAPPTTAPRPTTTAPPTTAAPTTAPPTTAPPTTAPPTTAPPTTAPPPGGGFVVGSGASAMTFPERPGLTVPESSLRPYTGPGTINSGTWVFENCLVNSVFLPRTSTANVTFRNCKFASTSEYAILGQGGRLTIEHCLFDGTASGTIANHPLVIEGGGSVRFSEFVHNSDNIRLAEQTLAEWNYIHAAKQNAPGAHSDGLEIYYGARPAGVVGPHVIVRNNYIDIGGSVGATGNVNITTDFGPVDGVRVEGNTFMPGGSFSLYVRLQTTSGPIRNVEIVNNRWFGDSEDRFGGYWGTHSVDPRSAISAWSGNTLRNVDGSNVRNVTL